MANFVRDQGFSEILVTGHSDRTLMANLTPTSFISTERARVAALAIKKLLPSVTLKYLGQGNKSPLVDGVFKNAKNRRVQIYTR
jgi:flagellar motor protein MotB